MNSIKICRIITIEGIYMSEYELDVLNQIEQEILEEEEGNSSDSEESAEKEIEKKRKQMLYVLMKN